MLTRILKSRNRQAKIMAFIFVISFAYLSVDVCLNFDIKKFCMIFIFAFTIIHYFLKRKDEILG